MTRIRLLVICICLVVASAAGVASPQKPAFSGTWIIQPPNKAAGTEVVIKQDDRTLVFTSARRTMTHQLDGVDHKESRTTRIGEIVEVTKAGWEGRTIVVIMTISYPNKMKTTAKETWSIDAQGQLIIDATETAEGQVPIVQKVVHKKKI